jgi:hypothetical protein
MRTISAVGAVWMAILCGGCGDSKGSATGGASGNGGAASPGGASGQGGQGGRGGASGQGGAISAGGAGGGAADVTFWKDVAPIYNVKCVGCHQPDGIAPFALDNYADALEHAASELQLTATGQMPPYFMVHDGSCGSFQDERTLTTAEKATIAA